MLNQLMSRVSRAGTPITFWLLVVSLGVFIVQMLIPPISNLLMLFPVGSGMWFPTQYLTAVFAHGSLSHVVGNMIVLFFFGPELERGLGRRRFLLFYLLTGVGANILFHIFFPPPVPALGASGAIYAILVMFAWLWPNKEISFLFFPMFRFKVKWLVMILVGIEVLFLIAGQSDGVAHSVHVLGALLATIYYKWRYSYSGLSSLNPFTKKKRQTGMGMNRRRNKMSSEDRKKWENFYQKQRYRR